MEFRLSMAPHRDREFRQELLGDIQAMAQGDSMAERALEDNELDRVRLGGLKRELDRWKGKH